MWADSEYYLVHKFPSYMKTPLQQENVLNHDAKRLYQANHPKNTAQITKNVIERTRRLCMLGERGV